MCACIRRANKLTIHKYARAQTQPKSYRNRNKRERTQKESGVKKYSRGEQVERAMVIYLLLLLLSLCKWPSFSFGSSSHFSTWKFDHSQEFCVLFQYRTPISISFSIFSNGPWIIDWMVWVYVCTCVRTWRMKCGAKSHSFRFYFSPFLVHAIVRHTVRFTLCQNARHKNKFGDAECGSVWDGC